MCVCVSVPPKVLLESANQAVSLSERVLLDCPVADADPPPVILWTKNDRTLQLDSRVQQLHNGSLAIYDSAVSHSHTVSHHPLSSVSVVHLISLLDEYIIQLGYVAYG